MNREGVGIPSIMAMALISSTKYVARCYNSIMKNRQSNDLEESRALQIVQELAAGNQKMVTGIQILLSAIPFAGGPLSNILSEYRTRRAFNKIYDTLSQLREAIGSQHKGKEDILKPDEVVEIIQDTLEQVVKTANKEKLEFLNNSLVKSFISDKIAYSQKQSYISILASLNTAEIELLREIYLSGDYFDHAIPSYHPISSAHLITGMNVLNLPQYFRYEEPESGETLLQVLRRSLSHLSEGALEGIIRSLDSKGLSNIESNLEKRTVKRREKYSSDRLGKLTDGSYQGSTVSFQYASNIPQQTPIEASRTKFGEDFVNYVRTKY